MIIKVKITKKDNEKLKEYAKKEKINYDIASGRAIKAFLRAQELKRAMEEH